MTLIATTSTRPIDRLVDRLPDAKPDRGGWRARCPSHEDKRASLGVREAENGRVLIYCHAGCQTEAVVAALGLEMRDLYVRQAASDAPGLSPPAYGRRPSTGKTREVRHQVRDLAGNVVAVHARVIDAATGKKCGPVWWELPDGRRGLGGRRVEDLPLFGSGTLPDLPNDAKVTLVEGEPACVGLAWCGLAGVATVTGASTIPADEVLRCLVRLRVVLWPDADDPGREHMRRIHDRLVALGCPSVELIEPRADAPRGWDAADCLRPFAARKDRPGGHGAVEALPRRPWNPPEEAPDPAPETAGRDQAGFTLTPLADLLGEPEERVTWLVPDLIPTGGLVFVAAKPKVGKSTLVRNLALAVAQGGDFLGRRCAQGMVIYLALEERRSEVRRHFRLMGGDPEDPVLVHVAKAPADSLKALLPLIRKHRPILVIIDPLLRFTRVRDERSYAELSNALEGMMAAAREQYVCIVATHHAPKATGTEAIDALLGSTALSGAADTVMVLRRQAQERTVETVQRYGSADLERTVLTLDPGTGLLRLASTVAEARCQETRRRVLELLGSGEEMTTPEVIDAADGRKADLLQALADLAASGQVTRFGTGRKGDPYRYHRPLDEIRYAVPDLTLGTAKPNPEITLFALQRRDLCGSQDPTREAAFGAEPGTESATAAARVGPESDNFEVWSP